MSPLLTSTLYLLLSAPAATPAPELLGVDVMVESPEQLQRLQASQLRFLGERLGYGPMPFALNPEQVVALSEQTFEFEIWSPTLGEEIAAELTRVHARAKARRGAMGPAFFDDFRNADDYYDYIGELHGLAPEFVEVTRIGRSAQSRGLQLLRISNDLSQKKPALLVLGLAHAREWIGGMSAMYLADQLIRTRESDELVARLLDEVEIHVIPMLNPDGYTHSWDVDRFWRKNMGERGTGVDLNRNWGFGWGGRGASDNPASDTYHGKKAFSESETAAVRDWVDEFGMVAGVIDIHSYAHYVVYPNGCLPDDVPNQEGYHELARVTAKAITDAHGRMHRPQNAYDWYPACGASDDYFANEDIWALTFELRGSSFVLPQEELKPAVEECYAGLLRAFRWIVDEEWDGTGDESGSTDTEGSESGEESTDSGDLSTSGDASEGGSTSSGETGGSGTTGASDTSGSTDTTGSAGESSSSGSTGSGSTTGTGTGSGTTTGWDTGTGSATGGGGDDLSGSESGAESDEQDGGCQSVDGGSTTSTLVWRLLLPG